MMTIGATYRAELVQGLKNLGFRLEKTHPDGRFEIAGVSGDAMSPRNPKNRDLSRSHCTAERYCRHGLVDSMYRKSHSGSPFARA